MKSFKNLREAYRKPTQAEIDADKRKERKASGQKRPSISPKSIGRKVYGNLMNKVESTDSQFDAWYNKSQQLDKMQKDSSEKLKKFPKGNMGLVPDSVKKDPKYRKAKSESEKIFKMIQQHNKSASKDMLRMARDRRRQSKIKEGSLPPHLQRLMSKDGNIDPKKVKKDKLLRKGKSKVTDVTPKGYGPK